MREYIASGGKAPRHKENGGTYWKMEIAGCSISESEMLQPAAIYDLQWVLSIAVESIPISVPISISVSTAFFELYRGDPAIPIAYSAT
jgi:hypothetical protein